RFLLEQSRSKIHRALGDDGGGRAISTGAGPAGAVARQPRTSAPGARIVQCPLYCAAIRQRLRRTRTRTNARSRSSAVGAAGFAFRVSASLLCAVALSRDPRRIGFGARLDKDLLYLSRQRDDAVGLVLAHQFSRAQPDVCRPVCPVPFAFGAGART